MKTKEQIEMEICEVIQNADNESIELNDYTLGQLTDYCYDLQQVKKSVVSGGVMPLFKKGDKITLNTGYRCDTGKFNRYEDNCVVWNDADGKEYKSPIDKYNITLI